MSERMVEGRCTWCGGSGVETDYYHTYSCNRCDGKGTILREYGYWLPAAKESDPDWTDVRPDA